MILATHLGSLPAKSFPRIVLTLGVFDGVHLGHQKVLREVVKEARRLRGTATVLTFQEHPQKVLDPTKKISILTYFKHKLVLLQQHYLDLCLALRFDQAFSKLSPDQFVKKILIEKLRVEKIILGHDTRFGHCRKGDTRYMARLAKKYGFGFSVVPAVEKNHLTVSSTLIRQFIMGGKLRQAEVLLGHTYSIMATVVRGSGRGGLLGFPTANLDPHSEVLPPGGVYIAEVRVVRLREQKQGSGMFRLKDNTRMDFLPAVLNLGSRPTFRVNRHSALKNIAEVHIVNFRSNLYGKMIEVRFLRRLRDEKKFSNRTDLRNQIARDVKRAQAYFGIRNKTAFTSN